MKTFLALACAVLTAAAVAAAPVRFELAVPEQQAARERCGPAALAMVMRYWGADSAALREAERAYDPALKGSLITDLAASGRRAGFRAQVGTLTTDSLVALLRQGVPPIVLYQAGQRPITSPHYAVVRGWDSEDDAFLLNDGGTQPRRTRRADLEGRWRTAGSQALVLRPGSP